ncbi:MAG: hypothetical protein HQL14_04705 [Candidatus Omnitrophica bacterium]|nr:hypothetical protein [Candidatus Omnitrophota bacterium]
MEQRSEFKRDIAIYLGIICLTALIVTINHLRLKSLGMVLILTIASCEALIVGYYFMHLMTKKKTIHLILFLTFVVFLSLLFLPAWDIANSPRTPSEFTTY